MDQTRVAKRDLTTAAWGALLVWWGVTELLPFLPHGTGLLGVGLILLGLNVARWRYGHPTSGFTLTLGILALVWGGLELAATFVALPFEIPVFSILLLVLGAVLLVRGLR